MKGRFWILALALLGGLAGGTSAAGGEEAYRLGPGDTVRITVFQQPDLNTVTRVAQGGGITFPLLGEVSVAGLTEREAELRIAAALEQQEVVRAPQVSLLVESYQSQRVAVLGQVAKPGIYPMVRGSSVLDLIAEAGGLTENAAETAILTRRDGRALVDLGPLLEGGEGTPVQVASGDRIFVPRMEQFYIYGQVNRPGAYRLERHMTVRQALSVAGGLTNRATERGLAIHRNSPEGTAQGLPAALTDRLLPGDVVYVEESLF